MLIILKIFLVKLVLYFIHEHVFLHLLNVFIFKDLLRHHFNINVIQ